jgi:hypothetical protein
MFGSLLSLRLNSIRSTVSNEDKSGSRRDTVSPGPGLQDPSPPCYMLGLPLLHYKTVSRKPTNKEVNKVC